MSIFKPRKIMDQDTIPEHRINRRADQKLGVVCDKFTELLGEKAVKVRKSMLRREIQCRNLGYVHTIQMDYSQYENRLWAFLYNLRVRVTYRAASYPGHETEKCCFRGKMSGKMTVQDVRWIDGGSRCTPERVEGYLRCLNHVLLLDRIKALDMRHVEVSYDPEEQMWTVSFTSLIGSSTWIMIPPVMQLIAISSKECAQAVEFIQMPLHAVTKKAALLFDRTA